MRGEGSSAGKVCVRYLEAKPRPLLRSEAGVVAGRLAEALALDATDQISLNLALLGDYRHAKTLAVRLLGAGADWSIDPSPEGLGGKQRAARFTVTIGQAHATGAVPALVLLAAVLKRAGR